MLFKKAEDSIISNWIGMKFGSIVPQVNMHRLTESMTAYFQDGGHDVHLPLAVAYAVASTSCLLARRACVMSLACWVCYIQFLN